MPGRLVMNSQHTSSPGLSHHHSDAGLPSDTPQAAARLPELKSHPAANGLTDLLPQVARDSPAPNHDAIPTTTTTTTNGVSAQRKDPDHGLRPDSDRDDSATHPPELEHWTESYVPFGKILERMTQHTYHELTETIETMAELQNPPPTPNTNGLAVHSTLDTSKASVAKKLSLINFAQRHKDRYVKALVLANWARDMDQMNRLIELTMWLRQQDDVVHAAATAIVALKHNITAAKMPNPNIECALEILTTGKASWMPKLGYIPPEPLTARQVLDTFRKIEFNLFTRLNMHEQIPTQMSDFTIANGRASFRVPYEFELDLAAVDDDPTSPLYFIDLRLASHNQKAIGDGPLRNHLETRINHVLASDGLQACYDFLHDFVLTYRIATLRSQALQLARSRWHGQLGVQQVHRSLILHYWTAQSGPKHWVEIGISSPAANKTQPHHMRATATLSCRWFRNAQPVSDHTLSLSDPQRTAEDLLNQIVAQHISGRLVEIARRISQWSDDSSFLTQKTVTSDNDPSVCYLAYHLHAATSPVKVMIELTTGRYAFSPLDATAVSANVGSVGHAAVMTRFLICHSSLQTIVNQARTVGWKAVDVVEEGATGSRAKPLDVPRTQAFSTPLCGPEWVFSVSVDLQQTVWSVLRLHVENDTNHVLDRVLLVSSSEGRLLRNHQHLLNLERYAVAKISMASLINELRMNTIAFETQNLAASRHNEEYELATSTVLSTKSLGKESAGQLDWCCDLLEIKHYGIARLPLTSQVKYILSGVLAEHARSSLYRFASRDACQQSGLSLNLDGSFDVDIRAPLGTPIFALIKEKLHAIDRLTAYIDGCRKHDLTILVASIDRFAFAYSSNPRLVTEIAVPGPDNISLSLLQEGDKDPALNPQSRLAGQLRMLLDGGLTPNKTPHALAFDEFCQTLRFTLPLMQAVSAIEAASPVARVILHCHSATAYSLAYRAPLPDYTFAITGKIKNGTAGWLVQERRRRQGQNELINAKLLETWASKGHGWIGLRNAAAARPAGVAELMRRLDRIVQMSGSTAAQNTGKAAQMNTLILE